MVRVLIGSAHDVHFIDQHAGTVNLFHHPQHVPRIDMDAARGARIEIPVRIDAFISPIEQQSDQFGIGIERCRTAIPAGHIEIR